MTNRSLMFALILAAAGAMPSEAAYSLEFNAAPSGGPGGTYGDVYYRGPNSLFGTILATSPYGIYGIGTPSNSGATRTEEFSSFDFDGNSGSFSIHDVGGKAEFTAVVSNVNVGLNGGSFAVSGFLSPAAASFFGLLPSTELTGVVMIQLRDASSPNPPYNRLGSFQLTLVAGTAIVPEPSSLIATGIGLAVAFGAARARRRRTAA